MMLLLFLFPDASYSALTVVYRVVMFGQGYPIRRALLPGTSPSDLISFLAWSAVKVMSNEAAWLW